MARVKRGTTVRARHKRLRKSVEGYRGTRSKLVKVAHEALLHARAYAYAGRRIRKRDMRRTWITAISSALLPYELKYSIFIKRLKDHNITINRKTLFQLALKSPKDFSALIEKVKTKASILQ